MEKIRFQRRVLFFSLIFFGVIASFVWFYILHDGQINLNIANDANAVPKILALVFITTLVIVLGGGLIATWRAEVKEHYRSIMDLQTAQQKTEARYQLLFETSQEAIILGDSAGRIFSANPSACKMLGLTGEALCRLGWQGIVDITNLASLEAVKLSPTAPEFSGEIELVRPDGSHFPVELNARLYFDENGVQHVGAFFRDITERKRAEQEQRFNTERFRSIFENSTAGVALVDLSGRYQMVNPAFCKIFGYSVEELLVVDFFKITHPDDLEISRRVMQQVLDQKGRTVHYAKRYIHRDGHTVWSEVNSVLVYGVDGKPLHFITHINDITERKRAEDALRESEERFRGLYENAPIGIYRITPKGEILMANPAALRILGYKSIAEISRLDLATHHQHELSARTEALERLEREGLITGWEADWTRPDGTVASLRCSGRVFRDTNGSTRYYEGTFEDISEQKLAEQEVRRRTEQLTALHMIDTSIVSNSGLPVILNTLIDHALAQLKIDAAALLLWNPATNTFQYSAGRGFRTPGIEHLYPLPEVGSEAFLALGGEDTRLINLDEVSSAEGSFMSGEGFIFYCSTPLVSKANVIGVLEVYRRCPFAPPGEWLDFLQTLATQAVIAIDNAHLIGDLQSMNVRLAEAYNDTLEGWARALDMRDKETEDHSRRVIRTTLQIARAMGIAEAENLYLRWGALLHDIGKIGIPDHILNKAGALTDEEMAIMKKHPDIAYEMLSTISFLLPAVDIPYCHHEKWDGSGYPRGLKGEQIPLAARIFALADVWDALRSDRPYRKCWPEAQARQYIHEQRGRHFDPRVVDVFEALVDQELKG